jgi:hypothetical protein
MESLLLILTGAVIAGAAVAVDQRWRSKGMWSAGYWWSGADRRLGPGC